MQTAHESDPFWPRHRVIKVLPDGWLRVDWLDTVETYNPAHSVPDLADPATLGCLLALVREAWGSTAHLVRLQTNVKTADGLDTEPACWWALAVGLTSEPHYVRGEDEYGPFQRTPAGPTEAEALIAALESAP